MRTLLVLLFLQFASWLHAAVPDSARYWQIVNEGRAELCNLIEYNSHVTSPEQMKFTVVVDGNDPPVSRVETRRVDAATDPVISSACVDTLNAILARTYADYNVEMYIIVIRTFDVIFTTPVPQNLSAEALFRNKLYDEQSNMAAVRNWHASITQDIITNTFSARQRDCLVYSRGYYTGALSNGKMWQMSFSTNSKFKCVTRTYPKLDELTDHFYDNIKDNPEVTSAGGEYSLIAAAKEFNKSARYIQLKGNLLSTYTSPELDVLFSFFDATDFENLTDAERAHALGVYAGYDMHNGVVNNAEGYTCLLVQHTPPEQLSNLLYALTNPSPLNTNALYLGDKPNQALIVSLIDGIDDNVLQAGGNYSRFMRILTELVVSNASYVETHLPVTDQEWMERQIYWDDQHILTSPPVGTHDYIVSLNSDARLNVQRKIVTSLNQASAQSASTSPYVPVWQTDAPILLKPFDLVVITNRSSLGMLQVAGAAPNQPMLAPAIFLKYCGDKEFNQTTISAVAVTLSTVAVLTGGPAIIAAAEAGNVALAIFEGVQFVGAYADLVANSVASAEVQSAVNSFNIIVGIWGFARLGISASQYTVNYLSGLKSNQIRPVPMSIADDYCRNYDNITSWDNVSADTKEKLRRMDELLGEQVGVGNAALDAANMVAQRTNFWQQWINKCFPNRNWSSSTFNTVGKNYDQFLIDRPQTYNDMRALSSNEIKLREMVESGSSYPQKVMISNGEQFYKIVPQGGDISGTSIYYLDEAQFLAVKNNSQTLEQVLGLPLGSVSGEYDVFTITFTGNSSYVFKSTVASTEQFANATPTIKYSTTGGATQTLILNNMDENLWSKSLSPTDKIIPNQLPSIGNQ